MFAVILYVTAILQGIRACRNESYGKHPPPLDEPACGRTSHDLKIAAYNAEE